MKVNDTIKSSFLLFDDWDLSDLVIRLRSYSIKNEAFYVCNETLTTLK